MRRTLCGVMVVVGSFSALAEDREAAWSAWTSAPAASPAVMTAESATQEIVISPHGALFVPEARLHDSLETVERSELRRFERMVSMQRQSATWNAGPARMPAQEVRASLSSGGGLCE